MYSLGIDCGSVATKAVLFNGKILDRVIIPTGWSPKKASDKAMNILMNNNSIKGSDIKIVIGTGYGRISMDFVDKRVTEITCHGKGAYFLNNSVRTILDIGGQDSKVISIDDQGNIIDFVMNDKCAAGTGRFLQVMVNVLGIDIEDLDEITFNVEPEPITSMCTVFAESEVISLLAKGIDKGRLASGIVHSTANRGIALLNKIKINNTIAFTGGVAKSKIISSIIEKKIRQPLYTPEDSQIVGALGAAVIGWDKINK